MRVRQLLSIATVAAVLSYPIQLSEAQLVPDAPVQDFLLPRFGEDGFRIWDLAGRQGIYVSPGQVDVVGMRLRVFEPGQPNEIRIQIESPRASIFIRENRAEGPGSLVILGPAFSLTGIGWQWDGSSNTILVHDQARVAFAEEISDLLR